ncbi:MAG: DUF998 domain-containing protein [Lewinellaceae bacterium]|nr:DUF998 domain-containing protein [Lewinellaceae bacterium]
MKSPEFLARAGFVSCLAAGVGQFATDYWFVRHYPGYQWMAQSVSYLGQVDSPVKQEVTAWGIAFAVLMALFGLSFYLVFAEEGMEARLAAGMILLYGLGEGAGSGIFPIYPGGDDNGLSTFLHELFSIIGDAGLMILPIVLLQVFPRKNHPAFFRLSWFTFISGLSLAGLFTLTKIHPQESGILYYRGVWQRMYILIYHIFLVVVAFKMLASQKNKQRK